MEISARDINEKRFHDAWRGYDQEEVDDFLDRVAETIARLQEDNGQLRARLDEMDHAVSTSRDTEEMLKKTLATAQQAAEEAIASAKAKAEALITEAEERAERANAEATDRVSAAEAEARRRKLQADREYTIKTRNLEATVERLRKFESELRERMQGFLEQQMHSLHSMGEATPASGRHVMSPTESSNEDAAAFLEERDAYADAFLEEPEADAYGGAGDASTQHSVEDSPQVLTSDELDVSESYDVGGGSESDDDEADELDDVAQLVAEEPSDDTRGFDALTEAAPSDEGASDPEDSASEGPEDPEAPEDPGDPEEEPNQLAAEAGDAGGDGSWANGNEPLDEIRDAPATTGEVVRLEDDDPHEAPGRGRRKRSKQKVGRRGPRFWKDED